MVVWVAAGLVALAPVAADEQPEPAALPQSEPAPDTAVEAEPARVELTDDPTYQAAIDEVFAAARRADELARADKPVESAKAMSRAVAAIPARIAEVDRLRFTALRQSLAEAEVAAFGVDGDESRLRRAEQGLLDVLERGYANASPELEAQVTERRSAATEMLETVQRVLEERQAERDAAAEAAAAEREPEPEVAVVGREQDEPPGRSPLVGVGAGVLALGGLMVPVAITGFVVAGRNADRFGEDGHPAGDYPTFEQRHRVGNRLGVAGAVLGGSLVTAGAVVLGVGLKRRKSEERRVAVAPWGRGVMLSGRF